MHRPWTRRELELLAGTFLFQGAPEELVLWAAEDPACTREDFDKGAEIYSPKRFRRSLGVLLKGTVQVSKGELLVSTLGPGDLFGAAALFHEREEFETTLTAKEPCRAAFFPQELVARLMGRSPAVCGNYIRYLSGRIHFLNRKIEALTAPGAERKLCLYLLRESRAGETVTCTATELARRLDVSRASLYRAFEALEARGAIRRVGKAVHVLDRALLEDG